MHYRKNFRLGLLWKLDLCSFYPCTFGGVYGTSVWEAGFKEVCGGDEGKAEARNDDEERFWSCGHFISLEALDSIFFPQNGQKFKMIPRLR